MKRLLILLAAAGLVLSACGNDSDSNEDSADATTTTAAESSDDGNETEAGYKEKLLTAADLPAGFKLSGEISEENGSVGDDSDTFCASLSQTQKDNPPNHEAEADFQLGSDDSPDSVLVIEAVSRYDDKAATAKAFDGLAAAFDGCKTFKQSDSDGTLEGTFTKYDLSTGAEKTYATRMDASQTAEDFSLNFDGDFVAQRKGQFVILLGVLKLGSGTFAADQLKPLAEKALAKV